MSDTGPARILEVPSEKLSPEQKAGIEAVIGGRGRLLTPYKIWLHSPTLMRALETLGTFLNKACSLSEREVELGIVLTAHHWHGEYVQAAHVKRLRELGVSEPVLDALKRGTTPDLTDARERAIYDLFQMAEAKGAGPDDVFERATKILGRNGLAETLALFGYYSAVAIAMKLHRVPIPT
jgi:4-carboxymuconolactone decarboxylase